MAGRISATASARANLIGNPSDQYGGTTLACSVPLSVRVHIDAAAGTEIATVAGCVRVADDSDLEFRGDAFDLGRAVLRHLPGARGVRLEYTSEIPAQSGVGGSSAILVALLGALSRWLGEPLEGAPLAETARELERGLLGIQCGFVDHYMAVFGGLQYLDFQGKARDPVDRVAIFARREALGDRIPQLPFLLAFTGVRHHSGSVHGPIRERWERGERSVIRAYERVAELGRLGRDALLRSEWPSLGELMNENHAIQRELGGSGESNEALIAAARAAGAHGAKLAGAGDGGTVVALWPDEDFAGLEQALRKAGAAACWRPELTAGLVVRAEA